ncbi:MAG: NnrS family protein [Burkholderiales bacterium]|nr:NnrS family protein [Burkholderiales bacterium]MDE1929567.1 NnrS family protein [Burkholderiales bacterium]MDE2503523.1 NnrS family protein [Burkholderiales bacterium]
MHLKQAAPTGPSTTLQADAAARGWPLWRLGFRPFYLGAALFGALALPLWIAILSGQAAPRLALAPLLWHGHEMLFGFAGAVIAGFLLTATRAWTGLATLRGAPLAALALLWLAARVAALAAPYPVYAVLDGLFLPGVAAALATVLVRAQQWRNLPLAGLIVLLALANGAFHLAVLGVFAFDPLRALFAALALIVMIESVIAGRVVPAFTANAVPASRPRRWRALERATLVLSALGLCAWVFEGPPHLAAALLALAAALHLARWLAWQPWASRGRPMLWILHLSYPWIPVGFALLALARLAGIPASAGVHAFAVGATAGLIVGMITRTARGHTGRALRASRAEVVAYGAIVAAALLRVLLPLAAPSWSVAARDSAALAWTLAFAIVLFVFTPWLLAPRADGRDG